MIRSIRTILLWSLFAIPITVWGQERPTSFLHFSVNEGLSQGTILCMLQDSRGLVWLGTADGLNRFNAYEFEVFRRDPARINSISDNEVIAIAEDSSGQIWIGTGNGLNRYQVQTDTFFAYRKDSSLNSISNDYITALLTDRSGHIWVGTRHGLNIYRPETNDFERIYQLSTETPSLAKQAVRCIYESKTGEVWVGFEDGLCRINVEEGILIPYQQALFPHNELLGSAILAIVEDHDNQLWFGTDKGLEYWNPNANKFMHVEDVPNRPVSSLLIVQNGTLWIGTNEELIRYGKGQIIERIKHDRNKGLSLSNDVIHSLMLDREGSIWVGTGSGLNLHSQYLAQFHTIRPNEFKINDQVSNKIWAIAQDKQGMVWFGTEGGLYSLRMEENLTAVEPVKLKPLPNPSSLNISTIYPDAKQNELWIGTYGMGLGKYDLTRQNIQFYTTQHISKASISSNVVRAIAPGRNDTFLWVGTPNGLNQLNISTGEFAVHQFHKREGENIKANSVIALLRDSNNMLWIGTEGGLICYEYQHNIRHFFRHDPQNEQSLSHDFVRCIFQSKTGDIWIGTSGGLNRWIPEAMAFESFRMADGLPNDVVYSIEEAENGDLWLGTNRGLSRFDLEKRLFENFNMHDGLQGNEYNTHASWKGDDGTLFFGGTHGLNAFRPGAIQRNLTPPTVVISHLEVVNRDIIQPIRRCILPAEKVNLTHKDYLITFEFAALDYCNPNRTHYAYMLEGFDQNWHDSGKRRTATYTNVPGGNYTFRVKAYHASGEPVESYASVGLEIIPPFWQKPDAWFLFLMILVLGVYLVIRIRTRRILKRNTELEQLVDKRTHTLKNQKFILEQSEALFRSFYEESPIGIAYVRGLERAIEKCNKRFGQMLGYSERELIGMKFDELTHPDDRVQDRAMINLANENVKQAIYHKEKRLIHKDGSTVYAYAAVSFQRSSNEKTENSIVMLNDTTEEKIALKKLNRTQAQLLHADKMASLGQLTAGVAHEINNPVNFIYSGVSALRKNLEAFMKIFSAYDEISDAGQFEQRKPNIEAIKSELDIAEIIADIDKLMLAIQEGAERTGDIVTSLRTFSRTDHPNMQLSDIHQGLDSTLGILQRQIGDHISLVRYYASDLPKIVCHPGQLNQVFLNILINAIHAIDTDKSGLIKIQTENLDRNIRIRFSNNGPQIPADILPKLFEPFFTTKEAGKGTGLGLSISYAIIENHKGHIEVKSNPEEGTQFVIVLPKQQ